MKRFLTLMTAIMMSMIAIAQSSGIVLSYNKGKELKFYGADQIAKAIDDAEVNDTIYFGQGSYSLYDLPVFRESSYTRYVQITKPLVFIGAGAHSRGTTFTGWHYLYLNFDSSVEQSKRVVSFEGILFPDNRYIVPGSDLMELKFINADAKFLDKYNLDKKTCIIDNLIIDRCNFAELDLSNFSTKHVIINNSKIGKIFGGCDSKDGVASVEHCFINRLEKNFIGLIQHSLVSVIYAGGNTSLRDCWYTTNNGDPDMLECRLYNAGSPLMNVLDDDPSSLGKCKDDTAYGSTGGSTPYTLYPQYPTPDTSVDPNTGKLNSDVEYDALNKKLTITVKLLEE